MRISDWSSDVCSSDLAAGLRRRRGLQRRGGRAVRAGHGYRPCGRGNAGGQGDAALGPSAQPRRDRRDRLDRGDRKSVVYGKSVSVRVDLGGRRIIKKKKQKR